MKKTALITGGAGFIGSHLCEELIHKGFKVICVDNLFRGSLVNLQGIINDKNFLFYNIDMLSHESINDLIKIFLAEQPNFIFHYAAINGDLNIFTIFLYKVACTNSIASFNLLEALNKTFINKKKL